MGPEELLVHQKAALPLRSISHVASGARGGRERRSTSRASRCQVRPCSVEYADEERMRYARWISQSADKEASRHEENRWRLPKSQARSSFEKAFCVRICFDDYFVKILVFPSVAIERLRISTN